MDIKLYVCGGFLVSLVLLIAELFYVYPVLSVTLETSWIKQSLARSVGLDNITELEKVGEEPKLILGYTEFYGKDFLTYRWTEEEVTDPLANCSYKCVWSNNLSDYSKSDAVVFHLYNNGNNKDMVTGKIPVRRSIDQKWVLMALEPPSFFYPGHLRLLNDLFNLTVTYQPDSDVRIPSGNYWPRKERLVGLKQPLKDYLTGREKMVVWLASNCVTSSRREDYVNELKQYIDVDVYGKCGIRAKLDKGARYKFRKILANDYKFYLAFESADCDDYITEKFWKALSLGMIPVVRGRKANYLKHAPPNSYIHADSFVSAKNLANYLKEIALDYTRFHKHHQWRMKYTADAVANQNWPCELCAQVHTSPHQTIDVVKHLGESSRCFTYLDHNGRNRTGEFIMDITQW